MRGAWIEEGEGLVSRLPISTNGISERARVGRRSMYVRRDDTSEISRDPSSVNPLYPYTRTSLGVKF